MYKKILLVGLIVLGIISAMAVRAWYDSTNYLAQARSIAEQDKNGAIQNYRRALAWSFSIEPVLTEALSFVDTQIKESSAKVEALRDLRRGVYGSRSFLDSWSGRDLGIKKIDEEILKLVPELNYPNRIRELNLPVANYRYQALALFCLIAWVLASIATIWFGFDQKGKPHGRKLMRGLAIWAIFFIGWMASLAK